MYFNFFIKCALITSDRTKGIASFFIPIAWKLCSKKSDRSARKWRPAYKLSITRANFAFPLAIELWRIVCTFILPSESLLRMEIEPPPPDIKSQMLCCMYQGETLGIPIVIIIATFILRLRLYLEGLIFT